MALRSKENFSIAVDDGASLVFTPTACVTQLNKFEKTVKMTCASFGHSKKENQNKDEGEVNTDLITVVGEENSINDDRTRQPNLEQEQLKSALSSYSFFEQNVKKEYSPPPHTSDNIIVDNQFKHLKRSPSLTRLYDSSLDEAKNNLEATKVDKRNERSENDPLPLRNLGNTCYMNSIVQSLFVLNFFINDLYTKFGRIAHEGLQMTKALLALNTEYNEQKKLVTGINEEQIDLYLMKLKTCVGEKSSQFNSALQQDAVEFLQLILSTIEEEFDKEKDVILPEENPIRSFAMEFDSSIKCIKCNDEKNLPTVTTHAMYLCVPEPAIDFTLQEAILNYFKEDKIEHKCDHCGHNEKVRFMLVSRLPRILFLQLGRYSEDGNKRHEIVNIPEQVFIPTENRKSQTSNSSGSVRYRLAAAVCHNGSTLLGGHYVSYVFESEKQQWFVCDDDVIMNIDLERTQHDIKLSGYCFFYVKCDNFNN
ncbi:ubiquitin carboxyl-terminal hydrolase 8-like protein [Dinothrombium tinctorium]|uniref:Ubiquitin carboxyl-terminal hydrolase 8-like protein n=1 Tax=Dinothrombium tinctorium TaxID=1965070 RepID=A0A3S3P8X7_9ACAR|nr:ubiquitin carboxyl-terminal hydrolase 8-like protein [Dinothrombium tinctorium]